MLISFCLDADKSRFNAIELVWSSFRWSAEISLSLYFPAESCVPAEQSSPADPANTKREKRGKCSTMLLSL